MALPHRTLSLLFAVAVGGTLIALAAGEAHAPGVPEAALMCVPDESEAASARRDPAEAVLVKHLSRRFFVAAEVVDGMVRAAYRVAPQAGLDPLVVLAVIAVESRFNPIAESSYGAKGLMQIIPKFHRRKLEEYGGEQALFDPESNITLGIDILREYVRRTGTLEAALQHYNGAFSDGAAQYAQRVMAERDRLLAVVQQARSFDKLAMVRG